MEENSSFESSAGSVVPNRLVPKKLSKIVSCAIGGFLMIQTVVACGDNAAPAVPQGAIVPVSSTLNTCIEPRYETGPNGALLPNSNLQCLNNQNPTQPFIPSPPPFRTPTPEKATESNKETTTPEKGLFFKDGIPDEQKHILSGQFRVQGFEEILKKFSATKTSMIIPSELLNGSGLELMTVHDPDFPTSYYLALVPKNEKFNIKTSAFIQIMVDTNAHTIESFASNNPKEKLITKTIEFFTPFAEALCQAKANLDGYDYVRTETPLSLPEEFGDKKNPALTLFEVYGQQLGYKRIEGNPQGTQFRKTFFPQTALK